MAYVDRLIELGEIKEINQSVYAWSHDRIFVKVM
ncbi:hypothetical protein LCGC14_0351780 [marine sediment metagenome]|uniref:Uncharacterized protein n=1 Tax=marine sediment metagenome TaxID=412755 RepID=A0A0F9TGF1_9ZZZZ